MPKEGYRYWNVELKSGRRRRRVHDAKTGRILKWEDVEDLDEPHGQYKIIEYVYSVKPTKGNNTLPVDFEATVRAPEGTSKETIEDLMREEFAYRFNEGYSETVDLNFDKVGEDIIDWSDEPDYGVTLVHSGRTPADIVYKYDWKLGMVRAYEV